MHTRTHTNTPIVAAAAEQTGQVLHGTTDHDGIRDQIRWRLRAAEDGHRVRGDRDIDRGDQLRQRVRRDDADVGDGGIAVVREGGAVGLKTIAFVAMWGRGCPKGTVGSFFSRRCHGRMSLRRAPHRILFPRRRHWRAMAVARMQSDPVSTHGRGIGVELTIFGKFLRQFLTM